MMKHKYEKHTNCEINNCLVCDGGLAICTICTLSEGWLTTDCPGHEVDYDTGEKVGKKQLDFISGKWVTL